LKFWNVYAHWSCPLAIIACVLRIDFNIAMAQKPATGVFRKESGQLLQWQLCDRTPQDWA